MGHVLADRYELDEVIGAGGMAKVHAATDHFLNRRVAVKVLDDVAARSADPASRERFLKEARSAASFSHHNAVAVYDAGQYDGELYIVMELVEGDTLAARLARESPLDIPGAVRIAGQMLDALAAMHAAGIVHRDIKPANVLLDRTGQVKLTDFGIAKRLDEIDEALTAAGTVIGTPRYLAPEQAVGGELGPRTDVYLVGAVLHEMLTGERPPSPTLGVPTRPPDPRRHRPGIDEPLALVVVRALSYRQEDRFASATEMADALDRASPIDAVDHAAADHDAVDHAAADHDAVDHAAADHAAADHAAADHAAADHAAAGGHTTAMPTNAGPATAITAEQDLEPEPEPPSSGRTAVQRSPLGIVAIGLLVVVILGVIGVLAVRGGADTTGTDPATGDEIDGAQFLDLLDEDPARFGQRGAEVRDELDAVLAQTDPARREAAAEQLRVDIFVWVAEGELDSTVGGLVQDVLDE